MAVSGILLLYAGFVHRKYIFNVKVFHSPAHSYFNAWNNPILKTRNEKLAATALHVAWILVWLHYVTEIVTLYMLCESGRARICKFVFHHGCTALLLFGIIADRSHNLITWGGMTAHSLMHIFDHVYPQPTLSILFCRYYFAFTFSGVFVFLLATVLFRKELAHNRDRLTVIAILGFTGLLLCLNNARTPELTDMCEWPQAASAAKADEEDDDQPLTKGISFRQFEYFLHPMMFVLLCMTLKHYAKPISDASSVHVQAAVKGKKNK
eukprot:GILK01002513.1.p1 GENE.GILK01002513.1~~GILK01002513.1.p1  ORF type:complete len:278 (+),score=29.26 GILK01002513.1:39-836(+)